MVSQPEREESMVEGNTAFALDLYSRLAANPGNLFFSPFSISNCLAVAYAGARGNTEKQMARAMHFNCDRGKFHSDFGELHRELNALEKPPVIQMRENPGGGRPSFSPVPGIQLEIANGLWAHAGHLFLPEFLKIAIEAYQAHIKRADLDADFANVVAEINQWVSQKTHGRIQNILAADNRPDDPVRLILANAIYFKGTWAKQFQEGRTSTQRFHLSGLRKIDAPFMHQTEEFGYAENDELQALELPYIGKQLSMLILLPRKTDGYARLEDWLTPEFLASTVAQMKRQSVEVHLPKFKLESSFNLKKTLVGMGMTDVFIWPGANFSGIDDDKDLYIWDVFHKAWGEVNEEGTEAAAATVLVATKGLLMEEPPPPPPVFRADHPFIFFIRHIKSGSLLFAGRLADPR